MGSNTQTLQKLNTASSKIKPETQAHEIAILCTRKWKVTLGVATLTDSLYSWVQKEARNTL